MELGQLLGLGGTPGWVVGVWGSLWRGLEVGGHLCLGPLIASAFLTVVTKDGVYVLDLAAKIDATADYICKVKWGDLEFPPPFGREAYPEVSCSGEEVKVEGDLGEGDLPQRNISCTPAPPLGCIFGRKGRLRTI